MTFLFIFLGIIGLLLLSLGVWVLVIPELRISSDLRRVFFFGFFFSALAKLLTGEQTYQHQLTGIKKLLFGISLLVGGGFILFAVINTYVGLS